MTKSNRIKHWDTIWLEDAFESMSKEIHIEESSYDSGVPGGSGMLKYLFINDMKKIQWIVDEFTILYHRLLEYDKKHMKIFV